MIQHVFNSSLVSGPETLVLPNIQGFTLPCEIMLLQETRLPAGSTKVAQYAEGLGHRVLEIPVRARFDFKCVRELARSWSAHMPAIVHAHGPKASLYALLARRLLPRASQRPVMLTTHHGVRANDQSLKLKFFETIYEKAVIPYFDLCLTVCTSDRELLNRRGIAANKLGVHLNGVDRKLTSAAERPALQKTVRRRWAADFGAPALGESASGYLVGVVGRLSVEKQHQRILEVIALLHAQQPELDVQLVCFGSGPLEAELKAAAKALGVAERTHWLGYRSNIAEEMAGLDLLLSLSNAEGLPINLIEAGWSGTPVLAQGVDGVRDLIEDGKSGVLLDAPAPLQTVADAIARLATDRTGSARMGFALQARVRENFSKDAWVKRLHEVYASFSA